MTAIQIAQAPAKTTYTQGEELDLAGLKVNGVWEGFPAEEIAVTAGDVSGFNSNNTGTQRITVTKNGRSATFNVEVVAASAPLPILPPPSTGTTTTTTATNTTTTTGTTNTEASPANHFTFSNGTITGYTGPGGAVNIPETINGVAVTGIGHRAFGSNRNITSVIMPNSVTSIGSMAFEHCTGLTSVIIPDGVGSIGGSAFQGCTGLTSITIPENFRAISSGVFAGTGLTSVTIPARVTNIGSYAFDCESLTSVTVQGWGFQSLGFLAFPGDLVGKLYPGSNSPGTYTRTAGSATWTKQ
jgi:hypothetical protein